MGLGGGDEGPSNGQATHASTGMGIDTLAHRRADDRLAAAGYELMHQSRHCTTSSTLLTSYTTSLQACPARTTTCEPSSTSRQSHALTPASSSSCLSVTQVYILAPTRSAPHSHRILSRARLLSHGRMSTGSTIGLHDPTKSLLQRPTHSQASASHVYSSDSATTRGRLRSSRPSVSTCASRHNFPSIAMHG